MSSKSKRNRNGKNKPSNSKRDPSGLLTEVSRQVLVGNMHLIVENHEQFHGPTLPKLALAMATVAGKDIRRLPDNQIIRLWDLMRAVIEENQEAYEKLMPTGSHDDCAMELQNGFNVFGWPDMPEVFKPILARGGSVLMPCPACEEDDRAHVLKLCQVDGQFLCFAAETAES
jgi:hypothetical protein